MSNLAGHERRCIEEAVSSEILSALAGNPQGMRRRELFPLCDSAGEPIEVSNALRELIKAGLIEVVTERIGNKGPAYARTAMDSAEQELTELLQKDEQASSVIAGKAKTYLADALGVDVDTLESTFAAADPVDHFDVIMKSLVAIKTAANEPRVIDDLDIKLQCLNQMAALFNADVAEILSAIAMDLEAAC